MPVPIVVTCSFFFQRILFLAETIGGGNSHAMRECKNLGLLYFIPRQQKLAHPQYVLIPWNRCIPSDSDIARVYTRHPSKDLH